MTNQNQDGNEYFIGPTKVESNGNLGCSGNNLILLNKIRGEHRQKQTHLARVWDGTDFGPEIKLPEGRRMYAFKIIGNMLVTEKGAYDNQNDDGPRAWVLEKGNFVEIPYLENFPVEGHIYHYSRTFTKRSPDCPLRSESSSKNFARVWDGQSIGPEFPIASEVDHQDLCFGNSFVAYSIRKKDRYDLVARVIERNILGKEQVLAEGTNEELDIHAGNDFLAGHSDDNGDLTAWVLREGIFTPMQSLTKYHSQQAGGGFEVGGNILAYSPGYDAPYPIYAYILRDKPK